MVQNLPSQKSGRNTDGKVDMHFFSVTVNGQQPNEGTTDLEHFVIQIIYFQKSQLAQLCKSKPSPPVNQNQSKPSVYSHRTQCHYASVGIIAVVINSRENTES